MSDEHVFDREVFDFSRLNFVKNNGVVTVITQDARTGAVLMVANADLEAMEHTVETGQMHYKSRTRGLWHKGETSGNTQRVVSLSADCDGDAVLARVIPAGPACHTGSVSCFGEATQSTEPAIEAGILATLDQLIAERLRDSENGASAQGYTNRLLADRNLRFKKIGEEAAELLVALADGEPAQATEEAADLIYHLLVALRAAGSSLVNVQDVLADRRSAGASTGDHAQ